MTISTASLGIGLLRSSSGQNNKTGRILPTPRSKLEWRGWLNEQLHSITQLQSGLLRLIFCGELVQKVALRRLTFEKTAAVPLKIML